MSTVHLISDLHFGHTNIVDANREAYRHHRPFASIEEHDQAIEDNWNRVVNKNDKVFVLGDVLFQLDRFEILQRLKGNKVLIMGNHDDFPSDLYLHSFTLLGSAIRYKQCALTHIPIHPGQFDRYTYNIHGHLHSDSVDDPRYFCVSADQTNFTPIAFDVVLDRLKERNL